MFLATDGWKVAEQQLDHNEEIEVVLLSIDEVKKLLADHSILQAMHVTTIMYALKKLEELQW